MTKKNLKTLRSVGLRPPSLRFSNYLHADKTTLCALIDVSSQTKVQSTRASFCNNESKALST